MSFFEVFIVTASGLFVSAVIAIFLNSIALLMSMNFSFWIAFIITSMIVLLIEFSAIFAKQEKKHIFHK